MCVVSLQLVDVTELRRQLPRPNHGLESPALISVFYTDVEQILIASTGDGGKNCEGETLASSCGKSAGHVVPKTLTNVL